jgi:hypothetical protein
MSEVVQKDLEEMIKESGLEIEVKSREELSIMNNKPGKLKLTFVNSLGRYSIEFSRVNGKVRVSVRVMSHSYAVCEKTTIITLEEYNQVLHILREAFSEGQNELINVVKGLISHYS